MKKLRKYLKRYPHGTKGEFARSIGITQPYLSQLIGGNAKPSLTLAARIHQETDGEVTFSDWVDGLEAIDTGLDA